MRTIQRDIAGAFIFSNDGQVLVGKSVKGGVYQDAWVVPGGGIETGESKLHALKREVLEERVLVEMTFYDFKVSLHQDAKDVSLTFGDDLGEAKWFSITELPHMILGEATKIPCKEWDT